MKKFLSILSLAAMLVAVSGCYDDSALKTKIEQLDQRVTSLESLNNQVQSLKTIVEGLQKNISITSVTPIEGGYKIVFSDGQTATILNGEKGEKGDKGDTGAAGKDGAQGPAGKDGAQGPAGKDGQDGAAGQDGHTPVISVKAEDGVYYWAVDDEFLLDADGKKVPVTGATPTLKIENSEWYVSYDGGATWTKIEVGGSGMTPGIFKGVEIKGTSVVFTLLDGTTFEVPLKDEFSFNLEEDVLCQLGMTTKVPYVITGAENPTIYCVAVGDFDAKVEKTDALTGNIFILTPATGEPKGQILVFATNGKNTLVKCIAPWCGTMQVTEAFIFAKEAGVYEIPVKTDISGYSWKTATEWISVPETKSDLRDEVIKIQLSANATCDERAGSIDIITDKGALIRTVSIIQEGKPKNFYAKAAGGEIDPSAKVRGYAASDVSTQATWITVDPTTKKLTVAQNTGVARTAVVNFGEKTLNVIQNPGDALIDVWFNDTKLGQYTNLTSGSELPSVGTSTMCTFFCAATANTAQQGGNPGAHNVEFVYDPMLGHNVALYQLDNPATVTNSGLIVRNNPRDEDFAKYIAGGFTIEVYAQFDVERYAGAEHRMFAIRSNSNKAGTYPIALRVLKSGEKPVYSVLYNSGSAVTSTVSPSGNYDHIVCTYDKDTKVYTLYVNGVKTGNATAATELSTYLIHGSNNPKKNAYIGYDVINPNLIGGILNGEYAVHSLSWMGKIANVRTYTRPLSAEEVESAYKALNTPFAE